MPWLVVAVAALVYANTLWAGFTWDDHDLIRSNPGFENPGSYLRELFLGERWWRPLQRLSLLADFAVWGSERPFGFHLTNLLLHAGVCLLVYRLAVRLRIGTGGALVAALLFAVHPLHVEAVANISHRKEPLALFFYLLGFVAYLKARTDREPRGPLSLVLARLSPAVRRLSRLGGWELMAWSYLCCVLAMLSKEVAAVMFPVTVVVWEMLLGPEEGWRRRLRQATRFLAPFALVLALFAFKGYLGTLPRRFSAEQISRVTFGETTHYRPILLTSTKAFGVYARLLVVPWPLYLDRDFPLVQEMDEPGVWRGLGLFLLFAVVLGWSLRSAPRAAFALAWYGLNLLPVINLVPLTYWLLAERFLYGPSVGFCLLVGVVTDGIGGRHSGESSAGARRRLAQVLVVGLLALFAALTARQNQVWKNESTLWAHTQRFNPRSHHGLYGYGLVLRREADLVGAEEYYRRSIAANPRYPKARHALALLLFNQDRFAEALREARALADLKRGNPGTRHLIAHSLFRLGRYERALEAYRRILEDEERDIHVRFNLALCLYRIGRLEEALVEVRRVLAAERSEDAIRLESRVLEELREASTP